MQIEKIFNTDYMRKVSSIVDRIILRPLISSSYFVLMVFLLYAIVYALEKTRPLNGSFLNWDYWRV